MLLFHYRSFSKTGIHCLAFSSAVLGRVDKSILPMHTAASRSLTDASCTVAAASLSGPGVQGTYGCAHPENCVTGTTTSIATEGTAKTVRILGWKALRAPIDIF